MRAGPRSTREVFVVARNSNDAMDAIEECTTVRTAALAFSRVERVFRIRVTATDVTTTNSHTRIGGRCMLVVASSEADAIDYVLSGDAHDWSGRGIEAARRYANRCEDDEEPGRVFLVMRRIKVLASIADAGIKSRRRKGPV